MANDPVPVVPFDDVGNVNEEDIRPVEVVFFPPEGGRDDGWDGQVDVIPPDNLSNAVEEEDVGGGNVEEPIPGQTVFEPEDGWDWIWLTFDEWDDIHLGYLDYYPYQGWIQAEPWVLEGLAQYHRGDDASVVSIDSSEWHYLYRN